MFGCGEVTNPDRRTRRLTPAWDEWGGFRQRHTAEEAAFRGYGQVILERVFPAGAAIAISSVLFALWHGPTQGFVWSKLLFYFVVGVVFGTTAYLTNSVLPALPVHILGDLTFFFLIWPSDAARPLVWREGVDTWFWVYTAQAIIFTALALLAFTRLSGVTAAHRREPGDVVR